MESDGVGLYMAENISVVSLEIPTLSPSISGRVVGFAAFAV